MEIHHQLQRNRLSGKVAVVTGVAEPVGGAIARRFGAEGARLVITDRNERQARDTLRDIELMGGTAELVGSEATTEEGARRITHATLKRYGRIDILVHSLSLAPTPGTPEGVDVDLGGYFPLIFSCASTMWLQGEGSIVLAALVRDTAQAEVEPLVQATTRAGLGGLVHAAAAELYEHGITVNGVALEDSSYRPSGVPADGEPTYQAHLRFVNAYRKAKRFEDVAHTARFLASSEARGVTGQVLYVSGGLPPEEPQYTITPQGLHSIEAVYRNLFHNLEMPGYGSAGS